MQHAGRIRRIADQDQIRIHRYLACIEPETGSGRQDQPLRPVAGGDERRFRFGELGMDDQRLSWMHGAGEHSEGLGAACGGQHLINGDTMRLSYGLGC